MVEKVTERGVSQIELMRAVSFNFDDSVVTAAIGNEALRSDGISMTVLGEKARLLSGIKYTFAEVMPSSSDLLEQENMQLRNENLILRNTLRRIEERLSVIEASLSVQKVIVLREISREAAKKEIKKLFATGKTLYYSDIAQELRLDLELVVDICNELQKEGDIAIDAGIPEPR
ncbi:MAG: hypothetical protein HY667_01275 [Chloroflexi bacterium]|nr:hypothetical protein [Chloroflexota bacterium]